ncbi:MAG: hypothetical protein Q4D98_03550 [Planctomycetia bacterium]|nr:hypothetical protein [Planctomycetia bacterium]
MKTTFKTCSGREYDLKLDFLLAKKLDKWDFSACSENRFCLLRPATCNFGEIYNDYALLGAIAFAVIFEKEKQSHPEKEYSVEDQAAMETAFTRDLGGDALEAMRSAVWGMLKDFFPTLASGFERVERAVEIAAEEDAKSQNLFEQMIRDANTERMKEMKKQLTAGM